MRKYFANVSSQHPSHGLQRLKHFFQVIIGVVPPHKFDPLVTMVTIHPVGVLKPAVPPPVGAVAVVTSAVVSMEVVVSVQSGERHFVVVL